jgi:hypothetical protein
LLQIISAPITPGTQAQRVSKNTIINEPKPLSTTAKGGKIILNITLQIDISFNLYGKGIFYQKSSFAANYFFGNFIL